MKVDAKKNCLLSESTPQRYLLICSRIPVYLTEVSVHFWALRSNPCHEPPRLSFVGGAKIRIPLPLAWNYFSLPGCLIGPRRVAMEFIRDLRTSPAVITSASSLRRGNPYRSNSSVRYGIIYDPDSFRSDTDSCGAGWPDLP